MGTTVIGGLGPGLGQNINPFDPNYQKLLMAQKNQAIADKWNADQTTQYMAKAEATRAQNVQLAAAGQALLTMDPPPHKQVLDAQGNIVQSTDLVCSPVSVAPPTTGVVSSPTLQSQNPAPDRIDLGFGQVIAMLQFMETQIAAIQAKLGA